MPETAKRSSRPKRFERLALFLGLASAAAMVFAALQIRLRPNWVGEFALDEAARRLAEEVDQEWRQLLREPERMVDLGDAPVRWSSTGLITAPEPPEPTGPAAGEEQPASFPAFDALLAEAQHQELARGNPELALETVRAALRLKADGARRARARLRAIQLGRKTGADAEVRALWAAALAEDSGAESEGGVACLLLGGLAAAPVLGEAERRAARDALVTLWSAGELALPGGARRARLPGGRLRIELPLEITTLAAELQQLSPDPPDERLTVALERGRARATGDVLGGLPGEPSDGSLGLEFLGEDVFAYRAGADGAFVGAFVTAGELRTALDRQLAQLPFFPEGFRVDLTGSGSGQVVREREVLWRTDLGYTLRHLDPESFMAAEERRLGVLQVGLVALALFTLLAGGVSYQSLRRQRVLAELKARFVANVSHELRTPVTGILLAAENLTEGRARTPERRERYHGLIRQEATRLRRLVDDVLDFSRLERGEGPRLSPALVQLTPFAEELARECRLRADRAEVAFEVQLDLEERGACIDGEAVRRAVSNLVDNALLHSGGDLIALTVAVRDEFIVHVDDNGRGVPPALRERIFEPFHQGPADDGPNGKARGTGLGLAIVREIARGHGGGVRCLPRPGGPGTRFELRLPLPAAVEGSRMEGTP